MNIREATVAALEHRYGRPPAAPTYLKTPVSKEAGQKSRLGALDKAFKGDHKSIAAAIGVTPGTLTRWLHGKQGIGKKNQTKLDDAYRSVVDARHAKSVKRFKDGLRAAASTSPVAHMKVTVTAVVRWTRSDKKQYNRVPHRTVRLDNIDMGPVIRSWADGHDPGAMLEAQVTDQYAAEGGVGFEGEEVTVEFPN